MGNKLQWIWTYSSENQITFLWVLNGKLYFVQRFIPPAFGGIIKGQVNLTQFVGMIFIEHFARHKCAINLIFFLCTLILFPPFYNVETETQKSWLIKSKAKLLVNNRAGTRNESC